MARAVQRYDAVKQTKEAMLMALLACTACGVDESRTAVTEASIETMSATDGALASGRFGHTSVRLADGTIYVAGGVATGPTITAQADRYDPTTGATTNVAALPCLNTPGVACPRHSHRATLLDDGSVLITGGLSGASSMSDVLRYIPSQDSYVQVGQMSVARSGHTATLLADGRVLITGGRRSWPLPNADLYNPATDSIVPTGNLVTAQKEHTATLLPSGQVLITGDGAELYDPQTGTFNATGDFVRGRRFVHTATLLLDGRVLVAGGRADVGLRNLAEIWDPTTGVFTETSSLRSRHESHTATRLPAGAVLIASGFQSGGAVELYDPIARAFERQPTSVPSMHGHTAELQANGDVLILGGFDGTVRSDIIRLTTTFIRGDANRDGIIDVSDASYILLHLFSDPTLVCGLDCDANNDRTVDIADSQYLLTYLFQGGPPPAP